MAYIISSGELESGIILEINSMTVLDGGIATETSVNSSGYLYISSGGTADRTTVKPYGSMYVRSGGKAENTTLSGGMVRVVGIIENTTMSSGTLHVANGGCASDTTVVRYGGGGQITVSSGGTIVNTMIDYMGGNFRMTVSSGGTANKTILSCGSATVHGIANNITIYSKSVILLRDGGIVNNATINSGGGFDVAGYASNVTVNYGGKIIVSSGGRLTGMMSFENGAVVSALEGAVFDLDLALTSVGGAALLNMSVVQGTPLYNLSVKAIQETGIYLLAEGAADFGGTITVLTEEETESRILAVGETVFISGVSYTLYLAGGDLSLAVGCEVPAFVVSSGIVPANETVSVNSGEIYCKTSVSSGGSLIVSRGGTAYDAEIIRRGSLIVSDGGLAKFTAVSSGGSLVVSNGGTAYNTMVRSNGSFFISSGGTANNTVIASNGSLFVSSGGLAENTIVCHGGSMFVSGGGTANSTTVNDNGCLVISSGGTANDAMVNNTSDRRGGIIISSGGTADNASVMFGGILSVLFGATANSATVTSFGRLSVNGTANSTSVINYGSMTVLSGGKANDTTVDGGRVEVLSGGEVENASVNTGGLLTVGNGGKATAIKENGGAVDFSKDANVTIVSNTISGLMLNTGATVHSGTTAVNITLVNSGSLGIYSGGIAIDTTVYTGGLEVRSGGTANSTTLNGGSLHILSGGTANCTTISKGVLSIDYRGQAQSVTVHSRGYLYVSSRGKVTGKMTFESGASVSMNEGAILDFDLTEVEAGEVALVNDLSIIQGSPLYTLTVDADSWKPGSYIYSLADGAENFASTISVVNTAGDELGVLTVGETVRIGYDDYTLNLNEWALTVTVEVPDLTPQAPSGTVEQVSWEKTEAEEYIVEYSTDNFEHVIQIVTKGNAVDMPDLPAGTYQWRVKADDNSDWAAGEEIVSENESSTAKVVQSDADGNDDLFFANACGVWEVGYIAQHGGSIGDWDGTLEYAAVFGKNKLADIFEGSDDANILLLTDDANGDGLFVDDIYTELPGTLEEQQARIARIDEIRAGAGDDIVDMTSQRFEYIGGGIVLRGGDGNDVLWANKGENWLFGDAGNDRIVGASGDDLIAGGIGDDRMHGGGGDDLFTFCENWGKDTAEQLATGTVTLWFASGELANWDADSLTYSDGDNIVQVKGVTADRITLKFGDDGSAQFASLSDLGAFDAYSSRKIFEEAALA